MHARGDQNASFIIQNQVNDPVNGISVMLVHLPNKREKEKKKGTQERKDQPHIG